ncbi:MULTISPECIES: RNA polymerase sigma factor [Reichenbachiella]|uniref:RNA polymerase sigma-70 factor, ECF subfamily n=1 Tax=Reichenbachiella agariperforans TaxID=156994 RepID=A0A1M6JGK9_REIAG|nr:MULTISPECIES: sigma-70 family RNA polymerase sigma factor [Reichenbachiella]RJE75451.1 RNA polymerase subunit sigma-70 [Reichenbachiella sp. MSK19-1]SHJ45811.1 RNA polymerase sigma-70 factor, ECF subfamily [Reichenbachiella agariperforans]
MRSETKSTYSDLELVKRCKRRDAKAQRYLYEKESSVMLTVCRRYLADDSTAEELMLIGFMKVFEKIDQFKLSGSLQGWIRRIMVNTCLEWIRKNKALYMEVDIVDAEHEIDHLTVSDALESDDLLAMVQELPQGYRTVFNMYAIEGYTHQDISALLGISVNTSKSQLSRARKWLQAKIEDHEKYVAFKRQDNGS